MGVDDLRLAFQWSRVSLPERTEALYFFIDTPDVWAQSPERLRDGLIDVGELMAPAIEVVVGHHLDSAGPVIIEGDGILPSILERPEIRKGVAANRVGIVFIDEQDEGRLHANYRQRARGPQDRPDHELLAEARAKRLFSVWIADEARARKLPVIPSRPFENLSERILDATFARENPERYR
jgi:2-phosphoglycerate kinase